MAGVNLPTITQQIDVVANTRGAQEATGAIESIGQRAVNVGSTLTKSITLPFAAAATAGVKFAVDVDKGLREVQTLFGQTGAEGEATFNRLKDGVAGLSDSIGVAQTELVGGLYQAISAGVPEDNAFTFLETAAKAAIAGVTDTQTAIDGITTIINAFGLEASEAEAVADSMFAAVAGGKTNFEELSRSMANVAPAAAAAGVSFTEINAAIATLTASGVKTSVATTQLRSALVALQRPTEDLQEIFRAAGFESGQAAIEALGLGGALSIVTDAAGGSNGRLTELLGSVEAVGAAQVLAGTGAEKFSQELERQQSSAGATQAAFETMEESVSRRIERLLVTLQNLALQLGEALLPAVEKGVAFITQLIDTFEGLPGPVQDALKLFGGLAVVMGPLLIVGGKLATSITAITAAFGALRAARAGQAVAGAATQMQLFSTASAGAATGVGRFAGVLAGGFNPAMLAATAAIAAAPFVISLFRDRETEAEAATRRLTEALIDQNGVLATGTQAWAAYVQESSRFEARNQLDDLLRIGLAFDELQAALVGGTEGVKTFTDAAAENGEISRELADVLQGLLGPNAQAVADSLIESGEGGFFLAQSLQRVLEDGQVTRTELAALIDAGLDLGSANEDVAKSFLLEADAASEAARAGVDLLVQTTQITEAQRDAAVAAATAADGTTDWVEANRLAADSQRANAQAASVLGISQEQLVARLRELQDRAEALNAPIRDFQEIVQRTAPSVTGAAKSVDELIDEFFAVGEATDDANDGLTAVTEQARELLVEMGATDDQLAEFDARASDAASAATELADDLGVTADEAAELVGELDDLAQALIDAGLRQVDARQATIDWQQALREVPEELAAIAEGTGDANEKLEAQEELLNGLITGELARYVDATGTDAVGATIAYNESLDELAALFPELSERINGYKVDLDDLPEETKTDIILETSQFDEAFLRANGVLDDYDSGVWTGDLDADTSGVEDGYDYAQGVGDQWSDAIYTATLTGDPTLIAVQTAIAEGIARAGMERAGREATTGFGSGILASLRTAQNAVRTVANSVVSTARNALQIRSPSRVFQVDVGEPITEGIAKGILEKEKDAGDAVQQVLDNALADAQARVGAFTGAISAGIGAIRSQRDLEDAQRDLDDFRRFGEEDRRRAVEDAERALADARREAAEAASRGIQDAEREVEDARRAAIRAADDVEDAERELTAVRRELDQFTGEAKDGSDEYQEALRRERDAIRAVEDAHRGQDDAARAVADAQRGVSDATRDAEDAARDIVDAERALIEARRELEDFSRDLQEQELQLAEAQLRVVDATNDLLISGNEWIDAGPAGEDTFRRLAAAAGLTEDQVTTLARAYADLGRLAADADRAQRQFSVPGLLNPTPTILPSPIPAPAPAPAPAPLAGRTYTVRSGDTLSAIAARNGLSLSALLNKNPSLRANPNLIFPGQIIQLAEGGYVRARRGGYPAIIGEGRSDEIAIPLQDPRAIAAMRTAFVEAFGETGAGRGGLVDIDVSITNPVPEPAGRSTSRELRRLAATGIFGGDE